MKKLLMCLLTAMLALSAFACAGPPPKAEVDITFDPDAAVTLTVAVSADPNEKTIAQAFADAYMDKYPNKTIEVVSMPGDYLNSVVFDYNAGILSDIIWMGDDNVSFLVENEVLMNLSDFMRKEVEEAVTDKFDPSLYYDSMMKMGKKDQTGDYYMFPRDYNKNVIFYNKTLLSSISASNPPSGDWTWDEFMTYCATVSGKMIAADKTIANGFEVLEGANLDWKAIVYPMLKSYGGRFLDENGKAAFKTEAMKSTLNNIAAFAESGYSMPIGTTGARGAFTAKKAAMYVGSRPTVGALITSGIDFGVASYPKTGAKTEGVYTNPLIGSGTTGYGINNTTTHSGDAWHFLRFIMGEEGQDAFSETGSCVPVLKSMAENATATWRSHPTGINYNDAFVLYPERDCTIDIFITAPANKELLIMGNYAGLIMDVTTGTRGVDAAIDHYFDEINGLYA